MKKSIYAQLVLIFIAIIIIGNLVSSIGVVINIEPAMKKNVSDSLTGVLVAASDAYKKREVTSATLEKLNASSFITIKTYTYITELADVFNLSDEDMAKINEEPVLLLGKSKGRLNLKIPISIVKSEDIYIVAKLQGNNILADFRTIILNYNLLSILCGTIVMLIVARLIIMPVKKITSATEKIAKGDFEVHINSHRKDEIGQMVDNFNKMTKELGSMEMLRNNFISDISHEFKTPLTSIEGYTKLLKNCDSEEKRQEYIEIITEETQRLSTLSGNILMLNRIENENINLIKKPFRLDEQIRHVILLNENKWSNKNLELDINLEEVIFEGNEQLLFQAWLNLLENAIKFSKPNESIEITLKKDYDKVLFSITDYGLGMTEEQQKRMFEKFYTGDKSRNTDGNGLGLSIVKRVIDMHGGEILVTSQPNEFTVIKVML